MKLRTAFKVVNACVAGGEHRYRRGTIWTAWITIGGVFKVQNAFSGRYLRTCSRKGYLFLRDYFRKERT